MVSSALRHELLILIVQIKVAGELLGAGLIGVAAVVAKLLLGEESDWHLSGHPATEVEEGELRGGFL